MSKENHKEGTLLQCHSTALGCDASGGGLGAAPTWNRLLAEALLRATPDSPVSFPWVEGGWAAWSDIISKLTLSASTWLHSVLLSLQCYRVQKIFCPRRWQLETMTPRQRCLPGRSTDETVQREGERRSFAPLKADCTLFNKAFYQQ